MPDSFSRRAYSRWATLFFVVASILLGSIAGNALTDGVHWLGDWIAERGAISPGVAFIALVVVATLGLWFAVDRTVENLRFRGIKVLWSGSEGRYPQAAAHVLILGVSRFGRREGGATTPEARADRIALARSFIVEHDPRLVLRAPGDGGGSVELTGADAWTIEQLCHPRATIEDRASGLMLKLNDVSWQQAWRVLARQAAHPRALLERIHVVASDAMGVTEAAQLKVFREIIDALARRAAPHANIPPVEAPERGDLYQGNEIRDVDQIVGAIIEGELARCPDAQICIDITGGTRVYAIAAAIASMREQVIMSYVTPVGPDGAWNVHWMNIQQNEH